MTLWCTSMNLSSEKLRIHPTCWLACQGQQQVGSNSEPFICTWQQQEFFHENAKIGLPFSHCACLFGFECHRARQERRIAVRNELPSWRIATGQWGDVPKHQPQSAANVASRIWNGAKNIFRTLCRLPWRVAQGRNWQAIDARSHHRQRHRLFENFHWIWFTCTLISRCVTVLWLL